MRILWLMTELLHPIDKGGKIRTYNILRELTRENHVTYLTLDDGSAAPDAAERAQEYCQELVRIPFRTRAKFTRGFYLDLLCNLASPLPYFAEKWKSAPMRRAISERVAEGEFDVLVCDFVTPGINLPAELPCATVLFQHNVEAMIWKRHAEVQEHPLKSAYLSHQWRKAQRFERLACRRFDQVIAVSPEDAEIMRRDYGVAAVSDVPTGVDTDFFRPSGTLRPSPFNLVFTGSMDWLPNEDGIRYFTDQILPRIKRAVPEVTLTVVGRNPYPGLIELGQRDPSVIVTGRVDDVRPYIDRAAAYIIPLRIGGGTRLKVYEAMAMEKPIVSTTLGAEGLPVTNGEHLLLADAPETFADGVTRVLTDREFATNLGACAASLVRRKFGWQRVAKEFEELCRRAIEQHDRTRKARQLAA